MVNQKQFECKVCKTNFKTKAKLLKHGKVHKKNHHLITRPMKKSKAVKQEQCISISSDDLIDSNVDHDSLDEGVVSLQPAKKPKKYRKRIKRVHTCTVCFKTFSTNFKLVRHCYTHMAVKPFPCDLCDRRFSRKDHLQVHYRIHTGKKVCYCTICGQGFNNSTTLHRHMERLHSEDRKTVECHECGLEFAFKAQLKRHYDHAHKSCFTCEFCGNVSGSEIALFRHLRKHVLSEPYVCLMCFLEFPNAESMTEHQCYPVVEDPCKVIVRVAVLDKLDFNDDIDPLDQHIAVKLQKKFDNRGRKPHFKPNNSLLMQDSFAKSDLNKFITSDLSDKSNFLKTRKCQYCEKSFSTEADRLAHETIHLDGYASATCSICRMKFSTNSKLAKHLRIHTGENPFPCKFCSKAFPRQDFLQRHMLNVHATDKETCPFCFKFCPTPNDFNEHVRSHRDVNSSNTYFCDPCDMFFTQYCDYKSHMLDIHSKASYKCRYCLKVFFNEKMKEDHQRNCQVTSELNDESKLLTIDETVNNDFELNECNICNKKFFSFNEKLKHLKMVHNPQFYLCDLCPCKFVTGIGLRNHRVSVHFNHLKQNRLAAENNFTDKDSYEFIFEDMKDMHYCKDCDLSFDSLQDFLVHLQEHSEENLVLDDLRCVLCNEAFFSRAELSNHMQFHDDNMIVEVGVHDNVHEDNNMLSIEEELVLNQAV